MSYVLLNSTGGGFIYPAQPIHLFRKFPSTSFPGDLSFDGLSEEDREAYGLFTATPADLPEYNPAIERAVEDTPGPDPEGVWHQRWKVIPMTEPEIAARAASQRPAPQWVQFAAALATDPAVNAMIATLATSAPVLHLMLGVGLGQAAQGDPQTFLTAWAGILPSVDEELVEQVIELAETYYLPTSFVEQLSVAAP